MGGLPESTKSGMGLGLEDLLEIGLLGTVFPPVFFLPLGALLMATVNFECPKLENIASHTKCCAHKLSKRRNLLKTVLKF